MTEAMPASQSFAVDKSGVTQKVFRSALLGFKREEVLEYIERIGHENTANIEQLTANIAALQTELTAAQDDNTLLLEKIREASETLETEKQRARESAAAMCELREQLDAAIEEAAGYKTRLFTREQETVVLKADNVRLNATIDALTRTVSQYDAQKEALAAAEQKARDEAASLVQNARIAAEAEKASILSAAEAESARASAKARQTLDKASDDALALVAAAEREKNAAKQLIAASAGGIAESISVLKAELAAVDAKIAAATEGLHRATTGVSVLLEGTEQGLQTLGVQISSFPAPAPAVHAAAHAPAPQAHASAHIPARRRTVADSILDGLTRILGERKGTV